MVSDLALVAEAIILAMRTSAPETNLRKACEGKKVGGLGEK
jgi:hypothetical protein